VTGLCKTDNPVTNTHHIVAFIYKTSGCPWRSDTIRPCLPFFFFFFLHTEPIPQKSLIPSSSFFQKILVLSLGSPPENLVLTLGSLPKKGEKKKPGINPGQPARKGRKKKTLVLTLGSPLEKGGNKIK
jgi:hypothetical protein